ncbi:MAG: elongation factor Ts [Candidatus Omnitrophica bacterium]|nr:elongation factor Ts [Candidatus Omnitrophota bacterium]
MKTKIPVNLIKELRDATSASIAQCRKALEESAGDLNKAAALLRKRGLEIAQTKQDRVAKEGRIESYIHFGNKIGVLLEVDCETDFAARNSEFAQFAKDLCMQIAASNPRYVKKEDIPADILEQEENKEEFIKNNCLMNQVFVKDASVTINDYLGSLISKIGENIIVRRFTRYQIGR